MRTQIALFHSALGLRAGVRTFADRLRAAGHVVHTPDLFDGEVFDDLDAGVRKRDALGPPELMRRAHAVVADLPADLVYAGFSLGAGASAYLAATRPGARAAILMHGALTPARWGGDSWPPVPVQVHWAEADPWVDAKDAEALGELVRGAGARFEAYTYPGSAHLFADTTLPEYDAASTDRMLERVLAFIAAAELPSLTR